VVTRIRAHTPSPALVEVSITVLRTGVEDTAVYDSAFPDKSSDRADTNTFWPGLSLVSAFISCQLGPAYTISTAGVDEYDRCYKFSRFGYKRLPQPSPCHFPPLILPLCTAAGLFSPSRRLLMLDGPA
jgi:hypothetical protein